MRYALKYPKGFWTGKHASIGHTAITEPFTEDIQHPSVKRFWCKSGAIRKASQIYKNNKDLNKFEIVPLSKPRGKSSWGM